MSVLGIKHSSVYKGGIKVTGLSACVLVSGSLDCGTQWELIADTMLCRRRRQNSCGSVHVDISG